MTSPIDPTGAFGLLSDPDRRRLLGWFAIRPVWSIDALATKLALETTGVAGGAVTADRRRPECIRTKRLALVHNHLPRLADHGVVEWDRRSGDVVRSGRYEAVATYLGKLPEREGERPLLLSDPV